jgi:hypothetical protein
VPALVHWLGFPVLTATATSQFVLAVTALAGTAVHVIDGTLAFDHGLRRAILLGMGALIGAQIGARLSRHVHGQWIVRVLGIALAVVGARLLVQAYYTPVTAVGAVERPGPKAQTLPAESSAPKSQALPAESQPSTTPAS